MTLSTSDLDAIRSIVRQEIGLVPTVSTATLTREPGPYDADALCALVTATWPEAMPPADWCPEFVRHREPGDCLVYITQAVNQLGSWYNLATNHLVYGSLPHWSATPGPFSYTPTVLPGYIGPTTDPAEILVRARRGQTWAGDAPVDATELVVRKARLARLLADGPGAAPGWYEASDEAATVLILGAGYRPYNEGLTPKNPYPCDSVTLAGVCAAITVGSR